MAAWPSLFCDRHDPVLRARDGAPDEEEIPFGIDSNHAQTDLGVALGAHVARHALALDHARRIGTGTDRAGLAVTSIAVSRGATTKAMPVHHSLEPAAFGGSGYFDQLPGGEDVHLYLCPGRRSIAVDGEAPKHLRRGF